MRRNNKKLDYAQRVVDLLIIAVSWFFAYLGKFHFHLGGIASGQRVQWYLVTGALMMIISAIVFKNSKQYDSFRFTNLAKEVASQIKANVFSFVIFLVFTFFITNDRISRVVLAIYLVLSSILLTLSKYYFKKRRDSLVQKIIIIGKGEPAKIYESKIREFKNLEIIKWADDINELDMEKLEDMQLANIVIGYDSVDAQKSNEALRQLSELIIPLVILPDVSLAKVGYSITEFKGQPLIYINEPSIKQSSLIVKRIFDFTATFFGLICISPIFFVIGLIIKFTSKGPVFYSQIRMGVDGKEFKMWKFRSMVIGKENHGGWTVENDPRVTKIGKFIRKTNIDELPQLWNVLTGDMSLVGPRPERPQYVQEFRKEIPGYMIRHKFKAGVTGWAQVNGWRGDTSIPKRIECDLWYIKNWSFWLDISIIFMTFFKGNKNAY